MKRKYKKGRQLQTVSDFENSTSNWFIVCYGIKEKEKTTHRGWITSWQYHMLKDIANSGRLYEAEMEEEDE